MVIGVCASYDAFVHWGELWSVIYSKFMRSSSHAKQEKFKTDADEVQSSDKSDQTNQGISSINKSNPINGMTVRLSNGTSKIKSGTASQSKGQRRETNSTKAGSTASLTAVFVRIGLL